MIPCPLVCTFPGGGRLWVDCLDGRAVALETLLGRLWLCVFRIRYSEAHSYYAVSTNVQSEIYPTTTTATTIKEQTLNKYKNKRKIHFRIAPQSHKDNDDEQQKHKYILVDMYNNTCCWCRTKTAATKVYRREHGNSDKERLYRR